MSTRVDPQNVGSNVYYPSNLVSQDFVKVLHKKSSPILANCKTTFVDRLDPNRNMSQRSYIAGETMDISMAGYPTLTRGYNVVVSNTDNLNYKIATSPKWRRAYTFPTTADKDKFYRSRAMVADNIIGPVTTQFVMEAERDVIENAMQHSAVMPSFGFAPNEQIDLDQVPVNLAWASYANLLVEYFEFNARDFKMFLNPTDKRAASLYLTQLFQPEFVAKAVTDATLPMQFAGFESMSDAKIKIHQSYADSNKGPLQFVFFGEGVQNVVVQIKNTSAAEIKLRSGDVIYHVANSANDGLHWINSSTKEPIYDTRYAFVVTDDKYLADNSGSSTFMQNYRYGDAVYTIAPNATASVSLSHSPIGWDNNNPSTGIIKENYRNINRYIRLSNDTSPDNFYVLGSHYKNLVLDTKGMCYDSFKPQANVPEFSYFEGDPDKGGNGSSKITILHQKFGSIVPGTERSDLTDYVAFGIVFNLVQTSLLLPTSLSLAVRDLDHYSHIKGFMAASRMPSQSNKYTRVAKVA